MGVQYPHGQDRGRVSDPGGETADGKAPAYNNRREMEIHHGECGTGDGGFLDNGGIHQADPEHGHTVYCYATLLDLCEGPYGDPGVRFWMQWQEQ